MVIIVIEGVKGLILWIRFGKKCVNKIFIVMGNRIICNVEEKRDVVFMEIYCLINFDVSMGVSMIVKKVLVVVMSIDRVILFCVRYVIILFVVLLG